MDEQKYIDELKIIISPYVEDKSLLEKLKIETRFLEDLRVNSANLIDIILDVEDKYDITVEDDEMDKMLNVGDSIAVIKAKLEAK